MSFKSFGLLMIFLMFLEMVAVIYLTRKNKEIFGRYNGNKYFSALKELNSVNPLHGRMIKIFQAAALLQWVAIVVFKYFSDTFIS